MRASTLFGLTIAILIGMAVVFGVKSAGLFDKKLPPPPNTERPKILVAAQNLFEGHTITRLDEVMVRLVDDSEMDQFLKNKHKYMPNIPQSAILRILARSVPANEPLLKDHFQDLGLPESYGGFLDQGMKAVNLELPRERAGGGILRKNDIVDVFLTTTITDPNGMSATASALIAPDLKVVVKRNSIWTMLRADDENKPIPYTLQANAYRAALIEFAKNRGYLTLVPTGPTSSKLKKGVPTIGEDKEEEKRIFNVLGGQPITERDLEDLFKLSPPQMPRPQGYYMTERWTGIVPRGGHTFPADHPGGGTTPAGWQPATSNSWQSSDGRSSLGFRFASPAGATGTQKYVRCDTCEGGKKLVNQ